MSTLERAEHNLTSDDVELREWLESLDYVITQGGTERARELLRHLQIRAQAMGIDVPYGITTPYINSIPVEQQPPYPGDREIERRIKSIVRWNAMAMVVRANREDGRIGGHISTFASAATLYEVGFNHFFRAKNEEQDGDVVYFQGHATPGIYARAYLEGRLSVEQLRNFRRELREPGGLSSYPHPYLMPDFWQFPTVSMGLGPIMSIYQARFMNYLEDRGLKPASDSKVWCFLGDGEVDEPETTGAITLASREVLDNLIWVINCNLQRLDGPVRGNGKIIQELEGLFRGAGWNVIKVIWGSDWDPLLAKDKYGLLVKRMGEVVDGQFQKFSVESGQYIREHFFNGDPRLEELARGLSDRQLRKMRRGGHDPEKVYAAYAEAVATKGRPTVILAKTIKGYGLGEAGEGMNVTHQQKKLNEDELREFRTRFGIPISDEEVAHAPFYRPAADSIEMEYLHERRRELGGYLPSRKVYAPPLKAPKESVFDEFLKGTEGRAVSTTNAYVRILAKLLRDKELGKLIVPIVPDEARTFGMDPLFRQVGIYAHAGQLYEPVDSESLIYYKEAQDGQILEEGITEAGSMSSFIAAGTAYSTYGINTIPFFTYYSMFGFQRIGDLIWAAGDMKTRGFVVGGTSGRTTLAGEGLQHQDGHSHVAAGTVPNIVSYDPAFAYELAIIIREGIRRMYEAGDEIFYYITIHNYNYEMPSIPGGKHVPEGVLRGMYKFREAKNPKAKLRAQLFGSGAIMLEVLKAQELLREQYDVHADVWSVTSYNELHRDALDVERWNRMHPGQKPRTPFVTECLEGQDGVFVAASDYMKIMPDSLEPWATKPIVALGTDGFGRSESTPSLRAFFEVDANYITFATLSALMDAGQVKAATVKKAMKDLDIDPDKPNPAVS